MSLLAHARACPGGNAPMRRLHPRVSPDIGQLKWHRHQQLLGGSHASVPWRLLSSTALGRALPARARVGQIRTSHAHSAHECQSAQSAHRPGRRHSLVAGIGRTRRATLRLPSSALCLLALHSRTSTHPRPHGSPTLYLAVNKGRLRNDRNYQRSDSVLKSTPRNLLGELRT